MPILLILTKSKVQEISTTEPSHNHTKSQILFHNKKSAPDLYKITLAAPSVSTVNQNQKSSLSIRRALEWLNISDIVKWSIPILNSRIANMQGFYAQLKNILCNFKDLYHQLYKWDRCMLKVGLLGVDALWVNCTFIPADWGS